MQVICLLTTLLASVASAHFVLTSPLSRGSDQSKGTAAPCGGFDAVGARSNLAFASDLTVNVLDPDSRVVVRYGVGDAPSKFPFVLRTHNYTTAGNYSLALDMAKIAGRTDFGTLPLGTIQVIVTSSNGVMYQCADVSVSASTPPTPATPATPSGSATPPHASGAPPAVNGTTPPKSSNGARGGVVGLAAIATQLMVVLPLALLL
ncbi:hypothetical protein BASA81_016060 [Batrachochytrium salamandrivorans]|nr:hypothetical protein BASA62_003010 [Batrachochytrium salamandrivorans]KAH9246396.1 hypothetical protein BASA81_016060 [Batrachochytrium salamandrivorans]